jgi:tryptophan halogenase
MYVKEVSVLGGGTAGLTTALILRSAFPSLKINLIRSDTIDIVGVGEGTTEHWADFLQFIGIGPEECFKHCGSTFKHGIYFKNWNGDNKAYLHNVPDYIIREDKTGYPNVIHKLIVDNEEPMDTIDEFIRNSMHYQPVIKSTNQFHFDTFKLNEFLNHLCTTRDINVVVDTINDVTLDQEGFIDTLVGEKQNYKSDFYVDATGFSKVLHKHVGSDWKDCTDNLPMNSAITFPTKLDDNFPAYTGATALNAGWCFQIPTQGRYGNGYVYCDNFINEDQAIEEATKYYGHELDIRKRFKFGAGYLRNPWNKNCLAIGLSASFIEPLEATNIGTAIQQAFALTAHITTFKRTYRALTASYNEKFSKVFQNTIDFVQLHYFTKRTDTEFWKSTKDIKMTDFNLETLEYFKSNMPTWVHFNQPYTLFNNYNWIMVLNGMGIIDRQAYIENWNKLESETKIEAKIKLDIYFSREAPLLGHKEAIEYIKENY